MPGFGRPGGQRARTDTPRHATRVIGSSSQPRLRPHCLGIGKPHAELVSYVRKEASWILCAHASSNRSPLPPLQSAPTPCTPPNHRASVGGELTRSIARALAYEREMLLMAAPGAAEHQNRRRGRPLSADLLQNCDLPPPAKLLGPFPTLQRLESAAGTEGDSLLRALRLSQSRARRAEEKLAAAGASNNGGPLAALLLRDSVALSAHRRWVMMLEAENSVLRVRAGLGGAGGADPGEDGYGAAWWVALAVCVGIAGVGLAIGNLLL